MTDILAQYTTFIILLVIIVFGYFAYQYWRHKASGNAAAYEAMDQDLIEIVLHTAGVNSEDVVYDLASGDGRIPITAAVVFHARAVGIETDRIHYLYSKLKALILRLGDQVTFINQDLFEINLSEASIVVMNLLQETDEALMDKLLRELQPGTIVITGAFNIPEWTTVFVDHEHQTQYGPIYYYQVKDPQETQQTTQTPQEAASQADPNY